MDANDKISDLEDDHARLKAENATLQEEVLSRPALPINATSDARDAKINELEKTISELEVVIANTNVEEAAKRERRLADREWSVRVQALERDALVHKELESKANKILEDERTVSILPFL